MAVKQVVRVAQNDLDKDVFVQIYDLSDDSAIDVSDSGAVVTVKLRATGDDESIFEETCTKVNGTLGIVSFSWPADSLDQDVGWYELEYTVTWDSRPQTALNHITVKIIEEFGAVAS